MYRKLGRLTDGLVRTCCVEVSSLQCKRATADVRAGHGPRDPAVECGAGVADGCRPGGGGNHFFGKESQGTPITGSSDHVSRLNCNLRKVAGSSLDSLKFGRYIDTEEDGRVVYKYGTEWTENLAYLIQFSDLRFAASEINDIGAGKRAFWLSFKRCSHLRGNATLRRTSYRFSRLEILDQKSRRSSKFLNWSIGKVRNECGGCRSSSKT